MSDNGTSTGENDYSHYEHQTSYVFVPAAGQDVVPLRPPKRRKTSKQHEKAKPERNHTEFPTLFDGKESSASVHLRNRLFEDSWSLIDEKIQSILYNANEDTLAQVTNFANQVPLTDYGTRIPTGLIVTGLNIASQELLFIQLAERLRSETHVAVVVLRSSDAPNLKTLLKKLIRDATNQKEGDDDDARIAQTNGHKLLNYDLQILHDHLKTSNNKNVIVAFQDSEAFDSGVISDALILFHSWRDRIQFVVLLGIATSVELFQERLPRAVTRCINGVQFEVEQTSKTLERVFQKVVAGSNIPLLLGPGFVTALLERQHDHVQSLQSFISALKYAYMCHFYANPLSILLDRDTIFGELQSEGTEAIRMLPSFRMRVETLLDQHKFEDARNLLESDGFLFDEARRALTGRVEFVTKLRRNMHLLAAAVSTEAKLVDRVELYVKAFSGQLEESDLLKEFLQSVRTLSPQEAILLMRKVVLEVISGDPGSDLDGWRKDAKPFRREISRMQSTLESLLVDANAAGLQVRSKYALQSKAVRATVVAQKVQLSRDKLSLSKLDLSYSNILDELSSLLKEQLRFDNPLEMFLHEVWLYDSKSPHREVFTPKPRHAIERALSVPHDYLGCTCCRASEEGLSSSQPSTAIIYQLYLETGGLINVFDLWSAFYAIIGGDEGKDCEEKLAFALFYRALADLKLLGMVKQSKRKTDHLAKLAWKGL